MDAPHIAEILINLPPLTEVCVDSEDGIKGNYLPVRTVELKSDIDGKPFVVLSTK